MQSLASALVRPRTEGACRPRETALFGPISGRAAQLAVAPWLQSPSAMRTKTLIHAAKLALVFLFVGCSSSGDGSSGATAELGIGGGHWAGPATVQAGLGGAPTRDGGGKDLGVGGIGGAMPSASHPGTAGNPTDDGREQGGAAGAGCASAHETGVGGKSGSGACSFFGGIFKCPGSSSAPGSKTEGGSGGHRGATPADPGSTGGAGPGAGTVIPRLL